MERLGEITREPTARILFSQALKEESRPVVMKEAERAGTLT